METRKEKMGRSQTRIQHAKVVHVELQVRHINGAVHDTVTIEYFEVSELIRRIWNACVAVARAHDLLPWNEASPRRIEMRKVYAIDCGAWSVMNLIERPEMWFHVFNEPITPSQVTSTRI